MKITVTVVPGGRPDKGPDVGWGTGVQSPGTGGAMCQALGSQLAFHGVLKGTT